ncbi:MAG: patatin-like phospholipase family protein [Burkholderiales bacterium]|nr:patatin-like phospholipase family protein [Burkholderiales bacterium]
MSAPRLLNLALQGGGAHGAFTWGVLDALLEDGRIAFDGLSGTSAGAMNAVVLAHGWLEGGRDGARAALRRFWTALADTMPLEVTRQDIGGGVHLAPLVRLWMAWAHYVTPAQFNPLDVNPLRALLSEQVDFERLRRLRPMRLFVAATDADSGRLRVFEGRELSVDALLASSCLPTVFHAPRIAGRTYWDGGYAGNPAVFPLLRGGRSQDMLLVLLSPLEWPPMQPAASAHELRARVAEISFTAAFRREMQALAHARGAPARRAWRRWLLAEPPSPRFHLIEAGPALEHVTAETRLAVSARFFEALHELGRATAAGWLAQHFEALGRRDSVDLVATFG